MIENPYLASAAANDTTLFPLGKILTHGFVALFGAITHAIRAHRNGISKGFLDFILLTFMSSFSGLIFSLVAIETTENFYFTLAAAGAGGFLGVEGLTFISSFIKNALGETIKNRKGDR